MSDSDRTVVVGAAVVVGAGVVVVVGAGVVVVATCSERKCASSHRGSFSKARSKFGAGTFTRGKLIASMSPMKLRGSLGGRVPLLWWSVEESWLW